MILMLAVMALAGVAPAPSDDTASSLAELQQMYDQSCAAREYGAYDDLCDQLSHQLRDARVEADRAARRKAQEVRRHSAVAPVAQAPSASTDTQPPAPPPHP